MKKTLLIFILALMLTACSFKSSPIIKTKNKYALVIGNNNYQETPLRNALIDAIEMKKFLISKGFNVGCRKTAFFTVFWLLLFGYK